MKQIGFWEWAVCGILQAGFGPSSSSGWRWLSQPNLLGTKLPKSERLFPWPPCYIYVKLRNPSFFWSYSFVPGGREVMVSCSMEALEAFQSSQRDRSFPYFQHSSDFLCYFKTNKSLRDGKRSSRDLSDTYSVSSSPIEPLSVPWTLQGHSDLTAFVPAILSHSFLISLPLGYTHSDINI